jgi:hypothetical protein
MAGRLTAAALRFLVAFTCFWDPRKLLDIDVVVFNNLGTRNGEEAVDSTQL